MVHPIWKDAQGGVIIGLGFPEAKDRTTAVVSGPSGRRKRNKGVKIGRGRRADLMRIPCYFCGGKPETLDHLNPRSRGGDNGKENLVSSCSICNSMKANMSYSEFIDYCERLMFTVNRSTSQRKIKLHFERQEQAQKIMAWHQKRMKDHSNVPVV